MEQGWELLEIYHVDDAALLDEEVGLVARGSIVNFAEVRDHIMVMPIDSSSLSPSHHHPCVIIVEVTAMALAP